jgi:hypothetical protein
MKAELEREHEEARKKQAGANADSWPSSDTEGASSTESYAAPEKTYAPRKEGCAAEECGEGEGAAPEVALVKNRSARPPAPLTSPDHVLAPFLPTPPPPPRGRPVSAASPDSASPDSTWIGVPAIIPVLLSRQPRMPLGSGRDTENRGGPVAVLHEAPLLRLSVPADRHSAACKKTEDMPGPNRLGDIVMHARGASGGPSNLPPGSDDATISVCLRLAVHVLPTSWACKYPSAPHAPPPACVTRHCCLAGTAASYMQAEVLP